MKLPARHILRFQVTATFSVFLFLLKILLNKFLLNPDYMLTMFTNGSEKNNRGGN